MSILLLTLIKEDEPQALHACPFFCWCCSKRMTFKPARLSIFFSWCCSRGMRGRFYSCQYLIAHSRDGCCCIVNDDIYEHMTRAWENNTVLAYIICPQHSHAQTHTTTTTTTTTIIIPTTHTCRAKSRQVGKVVGKHRRTRVLRLRCNTMLGMKSLPFLVQPTCLLPCPANLCYLVLVQGCTPNRPVLFIPPMLIHSSSVPAHITSF